MPTIIAEVRITLDDNNQLAVTGQFPSTVFAFGMIEMAKDAIRAQTDQKRVATANAEEFRKFVGSN
jgi:hypothetical protein